MLALSISSSSAATAASSKCPFAAAAAAARGNANNTTTSAVNEEETKAHLNKFLKQHNKEKFYNDLTEKGGIQSINALAASTVGKLSGTAGLPKTIARLLIKKARESIVAGSGSCPHKVGGDDNAKKPAPTASLPAKNFASALASTPSGGNNTAGISLKEFLNKNGKEKFYDELIEANYTTVEEVAASSMEDLSGKASLPKTIARLLNKKALVQMEVGTSNAVKKKAYTLKAGEDGAASAVKPKMAAVSRQVIDGPYCPTKLPAQTIVDIRQIWSKIQKHTGSASAVPFGNHFYTKLMAMDASAAKLFGEARMSILARDFDWCVSDFVDALSSFPGGEIVTKRDQFVARLVKYGSTAQTLWLAGAAFHSAAISVSPRLCSKAEGHRGLNPWNEFYHKVLVPPLHPTILKSLDYYKPAFNPNTQLILQKSLMRMGLFHAEKVVTVKCPKFLDLMRQATLALAVWKDGKGSWRHFEEACKELNSSLAPHLIGSYTTADPLNKDHLDAMALLLLESLPPVFEIMWEDSEDDTKVDKIKSSLNVVALVICGPERVIENLRAQHINNVMKNWSQIYERQPELFGKTFFATFTSVPGIAQIFQRTELAMQRERFTHQLNAIVIRLNEDMNTVVLPLIHELGARHRLHYLVGMNELGAAANPLISTVKEIIGSLYWTDKLQDSWTFVVDFLVSNMAVGWACGMEMLESGDDVDRSMTVVAGAGLGEWATIEMGKIKGLKQKSLKNFSAFFHEFAGNISDSTNDEAKSVTGKRYEKFVGRLLECDDLFEVRDRLRSLGRRHKQHHGVTIAQLQHGSHAWMSCAETVFKGQFTYDVALEWAKLWTLIAESFDADYVTQASSKSADLAAAYKRKEIDLFSTLKKKKSSKAKLELIKRVGYPKNGVAHLTFACNPPLAVLKAGQYAKIRWTLLDGKEKTRFYSIASPPALEGPSKEIELCIKEVSGGQVSPFVVNQFAIPATCELVMAAGHFTLPSPLKDVSRLMVSGGVGIVAFIGLIRHAVELFQSGKLDKRLELSLLHCEHTLDFPFKGILLDYADSFSNAVDNLHFSLTFCITRASEEEVAKEAQKYKFVTWEAKRPDRSMLLTTLSNLSARDSAQHKDIFVCGPLQFQKKIRSDLIDGLGVPRKSVHQEFFDL